jgi:ferric iron reductase protein FhuF
VNPPGGFDALVPAADSLVADAIARAGTDNPLLGIGTGTGLPAAGLSNPASGAGCGPVVDLIDAVAGWLDHAERRVAASLAVLGYAARLVGPTLAVLLREGILLDVRPHQVHYEFTPQRGLTLTLTHPAGWHTPPQHHAQAWCAGVVDAHLRPLVHAVRADTPVAAGLLWGNVASGITGALRALADQGTVPLGRCHAAGLAILDHGPLRGSGTLTIHDARLAFRRRSCCLYYRLDYYRLNGAGTCGDCPLG